MCNFFEYLLFTCYANPKRLIITALKTSPFLFVDTLRLEQDGESVGHAPNNPGGSRETPVSTNETAFVFKANAHQREKHFFICPALLRQTNASDLRLRPTVSLLRRAEPGSQPRPRLLRLPSRKGRSRKLQILQVGGGFGTESKAEGEEHKFLFEAFFK